MKCPSCAEAELVHDTRDMAYTYKGESTIITAITGDFCPACNDAVFDLAESMRVNAAMLALNKQVNASIVDPSFITTVRKSNAVSSKRDRY
ncbi:MAG: type II toxin-antitoxin system MqsA family antitoxin [Stigonema ocellatum SAG 48.90 = DSM 106950]|nr:type II toxin-antitoxin system MqsA family antitoxin [Stigonema ocellatum SAG 48.90 = DSM 106950]